MNLNSMPKTLVAMEVGVLTDNVHLVSFDVNAIIPQHPGESNFKNGYYSLSYC